MRSYYRPRYELFVSMAIECLSNGTVWNQNNYETAVLSTIELPFQKNYSSAWNFPTLPESDLIATSQSLLAKYGGIREREREGNKSTE